MKLSQLNNHQRTAYNITSEIISDMIGGYENTMQDYIEGSDEYIEAKDFLNQPRQELIQILYDETIRESENRGYAKHIKFAGTDFIKQLIDRRLKKLGY